jgi:hypothetical protein
MKTLIDRPDVQLFWSAYDPLDLASDSIDPLGFMAGYVALADRLLPGFTTVTTVPRYAAMLCHALRLAQEEGVADADAASRRRRIIDRILVVERAWALACGLAEEDPGIRDGATDGLRGVRSVHRWLSLRGDKGTMSLSFSLLSNQVRYGGIGAYSTFLESLHLADMTALSLRPLGEELADAFPSPATHGLVPLRDAARLSVEALAEWGRRAHAGTLTTGEGKCLRAALRGSEEAEHDDRTRWAMLRLLKACDVHDADEATVLAACLDRLEHGTASDAALVGDAGARIQLALRAIEPYERLYQCAQFMFDRVRAAAADRGQIRLDAVTEDADVAGAAKDITAAAARLLAELEAASQHARLGPAHQALITNGLVGLAKTLAASAGDPVIACHEVLGRHARVQDGKFDGGLPKGPWVRVGADGVARLTAQRFGLEPHEASTAWTEMTRHPYRTYGARQFIRRCRIA